MAWHGSNFKTRLSRVASQMAVTIVIRRGELNLLLLLERKLLSIPTN